MRTLLVILILAAIAGCQSKTYKPANWKELPKNDSTRGDGLTADDADLDAVQLNQFGELTDWTNPDSRSSSGTSRRPIRAGDFSTLPNRTPSRSYGTTLPTRSGTTLPMRSGTTLPSRSTTTLPQRHGTTLPQRGR